MVGLYIQELFVEQTNTILVGCAPCRPFSTYNQKNDGPNWKLLQDFARLIVETAPDVVSMENVPRLLNFRGGAVFGDFVDTLGCAGYELVAGSGYSAVYGRMSADRPAPTITTQFYGFGNGRFGHPSQDRALSLREGALLQGFPKNYEFVSDSEDISFKNVGRMIGNAVPVPLARDRPFCS